MIDRPSEGATRAERRTKLDRRSAVERLLRRHRGETGMVVDVRWPVTWIYVPATVERARVVEKTWLGDTERFSDHRLGRRRPKWVAMKPGPHLLKCESFGSDVRDVSEVDVREIKIQVPQAGHAVLTCWPAKHRGLTAARAFTAWQADVAIDG